MVFGSDGKKPGGGPHDGGRYGSIGDSGGIMDNVGLLGGGASSSSSILVDPTVMSNSSSSSSRSSVLMDDTDDGGFVSQDVYQRQPLILPDSYSNANGIALLKSNLEKVLCEVVTKGIRAFTEEGGSFYNGSSSSNGMIKIPMPSPSREEPRFPKEKLKTLLAFLFLFLNWILTTASLALTHERVPAIAPLPDITLDAIQAHNWGLEASEIIILVAIYFCLVVVVFHKHRFIILRRIFLLMGLLYFYRSITMFVTVLPLANPSYYCSPKENTTGIVLVLKRVVQLMSGFGLSINGKHTFCGDYIYSGHTMVLVMAYLIIMEYTPRRWWLFHWFFALLSASGVAMVLISRAHYTVDCVIAYYISTRLFYVYHTLAHNQDLKEGGSHNYFDRLWWYPMFRYFEKNVQGVVPRHYEWPFPWPRRWSSKNPQRTS